MTGLSAKRTRFILDLLFRMVCAALLLIVVPIAIALMIGVKLADGVARILQKSGSKR